MDIYIKKVSAKSDMKKFRGFPYKLYKGNAFWCPPMRRYEKKTLSPKHNPAFEFCESEYWLAWKKKKLVGRIAGIINYKANERWNEKMVRFGWIDFVDDPEVSRLLIEVVMEWGRSKGMTTIQGPLGFSIMDNEGMLIKGFDELGTMGSIYNFPYYPIHMEKLGFQKSTDWIQFKIEVIPIPEKVEKMANLIQEKYNIHPLKVRKAKELIPYTERFWNLFNLSFRDLYGFTELTKKQIDVYTKQYFPYINPDYVCFLVNDKDELVGFGISFPSLTRALQKCNGRLFPTGFIHLLNALKKTDIIDMDMNGVHPDYRRKGVVAIYHLEIHKGYIRNNVRKLVTNPQLDGKAASQMWKMYNGRQHITHRCWIKQL
jgi:hypothetical protein